MAQKIPAVVLAAGGKADKLALAQGIADKALLSIAGRPMIDRVLDALLAAQRISEVTVVADAASPLNDCIADRAHVVNPQGDRFLDSISAGMAQYSEQPRVLICTGDIPLIEPGQIDDFLGRCEVYPDADLCYSIIRAAECEKQFPGGKRTTVKLKDGVFTGGNVVTLSPGFLTREQQRFSEVFALRKSPMKLGAMFGWGLVFRLIVGRASIAEIVGRAKAILNCEVAAIESPYAAIGFDVDKPEDLVSVEKALKASGR